MTSERRKEKMLKLEITYKNGNKLIESINYLHEESETLFYTVNSKMHNVIQDVVKIPLKNIDKFDLIEC